MIISRTAEQCGRADYGWLQARYTFSFGHYFNPQLLGYASLRVLNQEVLTPGAAFQPRTYPRVDILNIILQGEAEYRDSNGNYVRAKEGEALLFATQPDVSYSEHNVSPDKTLTRLQLWLDACPTRENCRLQRQALDRRGSILLASPEGEKNSLQLRQQVWIHYLHLQQDECLAVKLNGRHAYLQLIQGAMRAGSIPLRCGDGAFIQQETELDVRAETPLRALLIDLAA